MEFYLGVGEDIRNYNKSENSENVKLTSFIFCIFHSFRNISANIPILITVSFIS